MGTGVWRITDLGKDFGSCRKMTDTGTSVGPLPPVYLGILSFSVRYSFQSPSALLLSVRYKNLKPNDC